MRTTHIAQHPKFIEKQSSDALRLDLYREVLFADIEYYDAANLTGKDWEKGVKDSIQDVINKAYRLGKNSKE